MLDQNIKVGGRRTRRNKIFLPKNCCQSKKADFWPPPLPPFPSSSQYNFCSCAEVISVSQKKNKDGKSVACASPLQKKNLLVYCHRNFWSIICNLARGGGEVGVNCVCTTYPTSNGLIKKMEALLECIHFAHTFLHVFGSDLHAQPVLINKNFCIGSSVGSSLRARCWLGTHLFSQNIFRRINQARRRGE